MLPLFASLCTVIGQLLYKVVAMRHSDKSVNRVTQWAVFIVANFSFLGAVILNFYAFKLLPLFIVYSFTSISYVLVTVASSKVLGETVRAYNYLAVMMIASGVFLINI